MSKARQAARNKQIGRKMIEQSRRGRGLGDILHSDAEVRKIRLGEAKMGAKALIDGTMAENQLKQLKRTISAIRERQTTDSNN